MNSERPPVTTGITGLQGFAYGARQPSVLIEVRTAPTPGIDLREPPLERITGLLPSAEGVGQPLAELTTAGDVAGLLLAVIEQLIQQAQLPCFEKGRIVLADSRHRATALVPAPPGAHGAVAGLARDITRFLNLAGETSSAAGFDIAERFAQWSTHARSGVASGSNVPRFLRAAHQLGIPFAQLPGNIEQYGYGRRARWMNSSFTDHTPAIGTMAAHNKLTTSALLREAGIPVPVNRPVNNPDQVLEEAEALGYPVVVKPANTDGGSGVSANLRTGKEVETALAEARKFSRYILLEKHFDGRDYRLTVFNQQLIWAIERVPGGVTGDGRSTVRELVEATNRDPRRGVGKHAPLQQLVLDGEALSMLSAEGMTRDSVPAADTFIRLRRNANVARGGFPVAVFDEVHPDNRQLALRAAAALRLDLAGVDLLIPDIRRSWKEVGAVVCEVNSQPNLGELTASHLYGIILKHLVPDSGRVPVAVILGHGPDHGWIPAVVAALGDAGMGVGYRDRNRVDIDGEPRLETPATVHAGGTLLGRDREVDAMILCIDDDSVLATGLPFDRYDILVVADEGRTLSNARTHLDPDTLHRRILASVLPACSGQVIALPDSGVDPEDYAGETEAEWVNPPDRPDTLARTITRYLLEAETRHSANR